MAERLRFCIVQVCTSYSLHAKRSVNRCLLLFSGPRVLSDTVRECFSTSTAMLLLLLGDVEQNPGPPKRSPAAWDIDSLPDDTADQMKIMLQLLKDVHSRTLQS